jgi:hypothetical protein
MGPFNRDRLSKIVGYSPSTCLYLQKASIFDFMSNWRVLLNKYISVLSIDDC